MDLSDIPKLLGKKQIGLTGFDPRFLDDPRFAPLRRSIDQNGTPRIEFPNTGQDIKTTMDPHILIRYLADLDNDTIGDDMWAVTAGGQKGTSQGDRSSNWFINHSKDIVGDNQKVTPDMINALKRLLILDRYGELRQTHPGKKAYSPHGLKD